MRILLIAHKVPYPPRGGATLRNFNLLKECSRDVEIHFVAFTQEPYLRDPAKLNESIEVLKQYCRDVKVFTIPTDKSKLSWYALLLLNLFSPTPYSCWRFWSKEMAREVKRQLARFEFDAVEIGCISLFKFKRLVGSLPKLIIHHNVESQLLFRRARAEKRPWAKAYLALQASKLRRLEEKSARIFEYHTTVSELDKETLLGISPDFKIQVVENGTDPDFFKPLDLSGEADTLVFAGGMSWYPNSQAMIYFANEIWPLIKKEVPGIRMNLVGGNPPAELIAFGKGEPAFKVWGMVDDVRPLIDQAAVYVVPIMVGGGTRLKILDAMAMGKAIVSTSIGCEGIEVADGHNIMIADDPEAFAASTVQLLRDPQLRCRLGENARRTAIERYSWKSIAPKLLRVYTHLAELKRRPSPERI